MKRKLIVIPICLLLFNVIYLTAQQSKNLYRKNSNLRRILIEDVGQNLCYSHMNDFLRHIFVYFIR